MNQFRLDFMGKRKVKVTDKWLCAYKYKPSLYLSIFQVKILYLDSVVEISIMSK
jgi:hypothetical protein